MSWQQCCTRRKFTHLNGDNLVLHKWQHTSPVSAWTLTGKKKVQVVYSNMSQFIPVL